MMMNKLQQLLQEVLLQHPDGLTEHALLKRLQGEGMTAFPDDLFRDQLAMFRAHFLLFHALYHLQEQLLAAGVGLLAIDARCIRIGPLVTTLATAVADRDPMRDFYLDLSNLSDTTADDVAEMLGAFWGRYYAGERRTEALATLGLEAGADLEQAQRRYRELAMLHHPDRGGDAASFRAIQEAIGILRRC